MRGERYIAPVAALSAVLAVGTTACGSKKVAKQSCESPPRISRNFPGDPNAVQDSQNTWKMGVEIDTDVPADATYLDIAYTDPNGNWHGELVPSDEASRIKMKVGHISVSFRTRAVAYQGDHACKGRPITSFIERPFDEIKKAVEPNPHGYHPEQP